LQLTQIIKIAYKEATKAMHKNEIPIGAVIFDKEKIISKAHNLCKAKKDPTAHAEILALKKAAKKINNNNLNKFMIYSTLEPCVFCSIAISKYRINTIYFGAYDTHNGSLENGIKIYNISKKIFKPEVYGGIEAKSSEKLIKDFFKRIRKHD
jgi:Cytosine/adenosine deaminases